MVYIGNTHLLDIMACREILNYCYTCIPFHPNQMIIMSCKPGHLYIIVLALQLYLHLRRTHDGMVE